MSEPSAWRIDKQRWALTSFDGNGAAKEGGRWNSAGTRVVYCSRSLAMAAQEKYVHLPKPVVMRLVKFRIHFNGLPIEHLSSLPLDWQASPPSAATQRIGDAWAASGRTVILAVPSVLIPEETNYLLNPLHPDFPRLEMAAPEFFAFDGRMARLHESPISAHD